MTEPHTHPTRHRCVTRVESTTTVERCGQKRNLDSHPNPDQGQTAWRSCMPSYHESFVHRSYCRYVGHCSPNLGCHAPRQMNSVGSSSPWMMDGPVPQSRHCCCAGQDSTTDPWTRFTGERRRQFLHCTPSLDVIRAQETGYIWICGGGEGTARPPTCPPRHVPFHTYPGKEAAETLAMPAPDQQ